MRAGNWRVVGQVPKHTKFVAIAAPHTSNWDFPVFMALVGVLRLKVRFLGKHTLFRGPMGWLFYWLGGIPVDRDSSGAAGVVARAENAFARHPSLILGLAPEGTRAKVSKWKTGFYRIAVTAEVPIVLAYLDRDKREVGIGPTFWPTGNMDADLREIQAFYADKVGINPRNR
ncbi:lysophospholipid acyltransferase family protein [Kordiimonas aestuarii]|uniref:lysophospholipid acyltransferase family protein n=1 Tax=Kordiimonas aestuarii TaxID=1005925 RepID=UPI0021CF9A9C|nr:lysophospholipid acyltransferase family protein [Kordiimonas aestuarii]